MFRGNSGSMSTRIIEPGGPSAFAATGAPQVTRWSELEKLAALLVELVTATTPEGASWNMIHGGVLWL